MANQETEEDLGIYKLTGTETFFIMICTFDYDEMIVFYSMVLI